MANCCISSSIQLNVDLYRAKNGNDGRESEVFGTDSLALDIMRSRDHGLTGYVHYLNACRKAEQSHETPTWEQLQSRFTAKVGNREFIDYFILFVIRNWSPISNIDLCQHSVGP